MDLNKVFYAPYETTARSAFFALKDRKSQGFPSPCGLSSEGLNSLLTYFHLDATYWTAHSGKQLNKEFKRRIRGMEVTGGVISNLSLPCL